MKLSLTLILSGCAVVLGCSGGGGPANTDGGGSGGSADASSAAGGNGGRPGTGGAAGAASTGGSSGTGGSAAGTGGRATGGAGGATGTGGRGGGGAGGGAGGAVGTGGRGTGGAGGTIGTGGRGTGGAGGTIGTGGRGTGGAGGAIGTGGRGTGGGTAGAGGMGGAAATVDAVIAAFCTTARTCCGGQPGPLADCEANQPMNQPAFDLVRQGSILVDQAALGACIAAYQRAAGTCKRNEILTACGNVFLGTKEENQPCTNVLECKRDLAPMNCNRVGSETTGVCQRIVHGTNGGPCSSSCRTGENCSSDTQGAMPGDRLTLCFEADGLFCSFSGDPSACARIAARGATCDAGAFDSCGSGAYCDTTCKTQGALNQPCTFTSACQRNLVCDASNRCAEDMLASDNVCMGYSLGP